MLFAKNIVKKANYSLKAVFLSLLLYIYSVKNKPLVI